MPEGDMNPRQNRSMVLTTCWNKTKDDMWELFEDVLTKVFTGMNWITIKENDGVLVIIETWVSLNNIIVVGLENMFYSL